jgi:hypothetical protein
MAENHTGDALTRARIAHAIGVLVMSASLAVAAKPMMRKSE